MTEALALIAALSKALRQPSKAPRKAKGRSKSKGRGKLSDAEKAVYMAKNDAECIAAFEARGLTGIQPRVNVLTYNKWIEKGRMVQKGTKGTQVGPFRLFHESDTAPIQAVAAEAANQVAA